MAFDRRYAVAGALLLALLGAGCGGTSEPVELPVPELTELGTWAAGGSSHQPPAPPRLVDGLRAWSPSAATTAGGEQLLFDHATGGDFDVVQRAPDGRLRALFASPPEEARFEANPSLAADSSGRLFAAWELGSAAWGLGGALREERSLVFAASEDGRAWLRLALPSDALLAAPLAEDVHQGGLPTAPEGRCVEAPRVLVDANDVPWLVYRYLTRWMPVDHARQADGAGGANRRATWRLRAVALTSAGWTAPIDLPRSDGPADGGLELEALAGGGLGLRWFTDQRLVDLREAVAWDAALPRKGGWLAAELRLPGGEAPGALDGTPLVTRALEPGDEARADEAAEPGGSGQLLFADLHRHTDGSRCKIEEDGTLLDQYRYAVEVGGLDVLAISNHFQHATPATWLRERDTADAFDGLALDPEAGAARRLVALYGYERALPLGHWTLVAGGAATESLGAAPFARFRPDDLWGDHDPATWLTMPHQIADSTAPLDWRADAARAPLGGSPFEPLAELYQSRRGSYEVAGGWLEDLGVDPDAPRLSDYLGQGRRFGFAASSDHTTSSRAYTGVRLLPGEAPGREAVLAALRARRTFAATTRLDLAATLGGRPLGASVPAAAELELTLSIDLEPYAPGTPETGQGAGVALRRGGDPDQLAAVELVHNGRVVRRWVGQELDDEGRHRGQLTLRVGRSVQDLVVQLTAPEPVGLGPTLGHQLERADRIVESKQTVELRAALDTRDEDGLSLPITWEAGASLEARFEHPKELTTRVEDLDELAAAGSTGVFRVRGGRAELRLDPPALGGTRLEATLGLEGLEPGDWLYLRLRTVRGEAAWGSPWFVE